MSADAWSLRHWVVAARPVAHGMIAAPLLWGQALALLVTGAFHWQWFVVIHLFGMLCQTYSLYLNDYADESIDRLNQSYWLSGGSRVIPDGLLTGQQLYRASFILLACLVLLGGIGSALGREWMPGVVGLAIVLAWTYSISPIQAAYRGLGELHQAFSCGAFLPLAAFYLQSGTLTGFPWACLLPICLIYGASNIITAIPDAPSDRQGGKLTYPVRLGGVWARRDALLLLLTAYVLVTVVSTPWQAWQITGGLVSAPAIALLAYVFLSGLVRQAEISNFQLCKRYIVLTTLSQVWVMVVWSTLLFGRGLHSV